MPEHVPIEKLKLLIVDYFERNFISEPPIYKIGDKVKTKSDDKDTYISKVIGVGKLGVVISECSIPLIDFGKIGEYYISQHKLKSA